MMSNLDKKHEEILQENKMMEIRVLNEDIYLKACQLWGYMFSYELQMIIEVIKHGHSYIAVDYLDNKKLLIEKM